MPLNGTYGLLAEFASADALVAAARRRTRRATVTSRRSRHYPLPEAAEALGYRRSGVAPLVFAGGLVGGAAAFFMQYWIAVWGYPINVGGRPLDSWPQFIPVTFELTVLIASFAGFLGVLILCGLPRYHHPLFAAERFARSTHGPLLPLRGVDRPDVRPGRDPHVPDRPGARRRRGGCVMSRGRALMLLLIAALPLGCQQKMADQPSYRPLQPSRPVRGRDVGPSLARGGRRPPVGPLGRSAGQRPEGGVPGRLAGPGRGPRGRPGPRRRTRPTDPGPVRHRLSPRARRATTWSGVRSGTPSSAPSATTRSGPDCGKIVERGYVRPPDYHTERSRGFARYGKSIALRDVPAGYLFEVITRGYGAMPRYAPQVPPADRWRIVAYVRALQLSQHAVLGDLPPAGARP